MELKLSLQLLQACFSLSRLDLEDFLQESLWNEKYNYVIVKKKNKKKNRKTIHGVLLLTKMLFGFHTILEKNSHQLCWWPMAGSAIGCFWCGNMWSEITKSIPQVTLCPLVPLLPLSDLISPFVGKEEEELATRASQEELSFQHSSPPSCCNISWLR